MCVLYPLKTVIDCSYATLGTAVFFTKNDVYAFNIREMKQNAQNNLLSQLKTSFHSLFYFFSSIMYPVLFLAPDYF